MSTFNDEELEELDTIAPGSVFVRELVGIVLGEATIYKSQDVERLTLAQTEKALKRFAKSLGKVRDDLSAEWRGLDRELRHTVTDLLDGWRPQTLTPIANQIAEYATYIGMVKPKGGPYRRYAPIRVARRVSEIFRRRKLKIVTTPESDFVVTLRCVFRAANIEANARNVTGTLIKELQQKSH